MGKLDYSAFSKNMSGFASDRAVKLLNRRTSSATNRSHFSGSSAKAGIPRQGKDGVHPDC
jgi:hypothetical protein